MTLATGTLLPSAITPLACDLSSLASSATFVGGRESNEVDNTSNRFLDVLVTIDPIAGHASTPPAVGQWIGVYVWGSDTSLSTAALDALDGADSAESLAHAGILGGLVLATSNVVTVATAGLKYPMKPFSIAKCFGGLMPNYWGLFIAHNHAGALGASNSGLVSYQGFKQDLS